MTLPRWYAHFRRFVDPSGAYVHLGATSYDIVDTANALQLKDALEVIEKRLVDFKAILQKQALLHKDTVMIGRTHGQHALPITLGFKFAVWGYEINRHLERLEECKKRVLVGKVSGAVGTQAGLGEHAETDSRARNETAWFAGG